ncbi:alpha/beta hydrolase [Roseisalinus antarcticus]|uniref:Alpha/beta hydrolase family protein n=1 Tax=Roseisalinus antarcticus TaxID=254357 RepID=A0A1Y5SVQ7_9RHOB|nr:alpha/beta fold hydrolase [Roseisalinus antarcticus]SLN49711.1 Alpha/beta hydrolase family protein [Roseisalinus antarcticus]
MTRRRILVALVAAILVAASVTMLERARAGLEITALQAGETPATLYRLPGVEGPLVVVAHGFAGSRQLMQAYSLTLAKAGYAVLAFDFEGHGRNPEPMSGDVTSVDGTTARLVAETREVLTLGRARVGETGGVALLGHSMATDVIVRAALAEAEAGHPVDAVVTISMFSQAVTASAPQRLLAISGEWEGRLRDAALAAARLVQLDAAEGETVQAGDVLRRAVVAPGVEHVGVLYSATAVREAQLWLDAAFGREGAVAPVRVGPWILALLGGIVALTYPLVGLLPKARVRPAEIPARRFWAAVLLPAALVPLVATTIYIPFLPVLVADYLMLHLVLLGGLQLVLLRVWRLGGPPLSAGAALALALWGIGVFGLAMDRYAASFVPNAERLVVIAALAFGTVPFMIADSYATGAGRGRWWRRIAARLALFLSLAAAAAIDPERLLFLVIILPVLLLFFVVHGLMGRWVGARCGPLAAGLGLGLCLAWALGVSFPLFSAG